MKKAACIIFVLILLVSGCTKQSKLPSKLADVKFKLEPSEIQYTFDGFHSELDGDKLLVYSGEKLELIDLKNNKLIKEILQSKKFNIYGFDISGDIVTWAEVADQIDNNSSRELTEQNIDIFAYNIKTGEKKQITQDKSTQFNPKVWKNYLIWQDNRNDKSKEYPGRWSLYLFDLNSGEEKKITSTLAPYSTYNICDNKIVWEDERNFKGSNVIRGGGNLPENNKDIYLYNIETGKESAIATGPYMECKPDVSGNYIVWEDRNNGTYNADIVLYNLENKESVYITKDDVDQGTPRILRDYIVWMDERRGTSTNDVIVNGKEPNSDVIVYDIKSKTGRIITGDGPQIQPCISDEWIAFKLSRQVEPKVQVVKYK